MKDYFRFLLADDLPQGVPLADITNDMGDISRQPQAFKKIWLGVRLEGVSGHRGAHGLQPECQPGPFETGMAGYKDPSVPEYILK